MKKPSVNCYSDGEGRFMDWWQTIRGKSLEPFLRVLGNRGVRPSHITLISLFFGVLFCPFFITGIYPIAFACLLLHLLLDGIDGPLARFMGVAGTKGSFTDTLADQVVVTASTITLIYTGHAGAWSGGWYIFLYLLVVSFAMVRNALTCPYSWLFRPRIIIYAWLVVEINFWPGKLEILLWAMTAILALKALTGFRAIRQSI